MGMWILTCMWSILIPVGHIFASDCVFPPEWRGTWYDSRLKQVEISGTSISRKGTCLQRDGNKFLMLNKGASNRKCFKCIVFTPWHPNLLQYKESPCWHEESLDNVCQEIMGDIPLQTVVKINSIPEPCPFQGTYTFSYTNGSSQCQYPQSEVRSCADESKFRFSYRHCSGVPGTSNIELDFQCLATWENGEKFLYGRFSRAGTSAEHDKYRCFMHSFYGTTGEMSMSADATCQGLQSPSLGVVTMELSKDIASYIRGSCKFPKFLVRQQTWRDLTGKYVLEADTGLQVLRIRDRSPDNYVVYTDVAHYPVTRTVFRCVQSMGETYHSVPGVKVMEYVAYTTNDDCESARKCLLFKKRSHDVVELIVGNTIQESDTVCQYETPEKYLLIPERTHLNSCPSILLGTYQYTDKASDCSGYFNIGCSLDEEIVIETTCASNHKSVKILQCVKSWAEESTAYVIVSNPDDTSNSLLCLIFMDTEFGKEVQASASCEGDRRVVTNQYLNYLIYKPHGKCTTKHENLQSDQNSNPNEYIEADDGMPRSKASCLHNTLSHLPLACIILCIVYSYNLVFR